MHARDAFLIKHTQTDTALTITTSSKETGWVMHKTLAEVLDPLALHRVLLLHVLQLPLRLGDAALQVGRKGDEVLLSLGECGFGDGALLFTAKSTSRVKGPV